MDPAKLVLDENTPLNKLVFVGASDKSADAYLREALLAVARHFDIKPEKTFAALPRKAREAFFFGLPDKIEFRYGEYKYQAEWKGATAWLLDILKQLEAQEADARGEKTRGAFEALISPITCRACPWAKVATRIARRAPQ